MVSNIKNLEQKKIELTQYLANLKEKNLKIWWNFRSNLSLEKHQKTALSSQNITTTRSK